MDSSLVNLSEMLNQTIAGQNKDDPVPSNEIITAPICMVKTRQQMDQNIWTPWEGGHSETELCKMQENDPDFGPLLKMEEKWLSALRGLASFGFTEALGNQSPGNTYGHSSRGSISTYQQSKTDPISSNGSGSTSHCPIQTQAPVRAAAPLSTQHVQTKAAVRVSGLPATHPYPTGNTYHVAVATPSLQSRLGPPVCVGAASLRRLATPVSPSVPSSFVDAPAATVGLAANQVMPLKSSTPMDDLYDFFMPDVTMTSVADHSNTISSAISHYLPLETPTSSSSVPPITSANPHVYFTMSTVLTATTRTYQESSMRPETPMSTTCTSSPDQDPYSPEISPTVQYIFDQDLIQDEDAEYILPQILGSEVPLTSTPKPQPVQTPPPSLAQPPTHNLNQHILTALSTFTTTQEFLLKEITRNTKAIQTLSTVIAYLRGQFRQFERVQGRHQTVQDRLSNLSNRPFKQIRRKPYLNRHKLQQRQPKVKSVVQ
ncbi:Hypothetical predicted protein [Mytilus galloprovincialis]|uniref:Uncharacterized protein n=1 Tax=Mytilus galloprovincialis TaxID=29158 RepID=A0A8B6CXI6_MYTGA|nr:Hypothetical predicted protein [Mytilus galloprovincialis]